jgi:hypothetical protein
MQQQLLLLEGAEETPAAAAPSTLVLYVFSDHEAAAADNLAFFVREVMQGVGWAVGLLLLPPVLWSGAQACCCTSPHQPCLPRRPQGMQAGDGCTYAIIVQGTPTAPLPELPAGVDATYLAHTNQCYDWGTVGWCLRCVGTHGACWPHN